MKIQVDKLPVDFVKNSTYWEGLKDLTNIDIININPNGNKLSYNEFCVMFLNKAKKYIKPIDNKKDLISLNEEELDKLHQELISESYVYLTSYPNLINILSLHI